MDRARAPATHATLAAREAALSGLARGCRFQHAARAEPRGGPEPRHGRVDSRASQSPDHRARPGSGNPGWRRPSSRARVATASPPPTCGRRACCTSSPSVAATDRMPGSWRNSPSSISSRSMIGCSRRSPMPNGATCWRSSKIGANGRSTLIASQLPPTAWHAAIGEPSRRRCDLRPADPSRAPAHAERAHDARPRDATRDEGRRHDPRSQRARGRHATGRSDGRSSFLGHPGGSSIGEEPVDRAAGMEIAQNAIPTPAWTAHRTRRPQRPTGPVVFDERKNEYVR